MDETGVEKRLPRRALWFLAVGAVLAYAVVVPLKAAGMMPPDMTWFRLLAIPAVGFGMIAGEMAALSLFDRHSPWIMAVHAACVAAIFAVLAVEGR